MCDRFRGYYPVVVDVETAGFNDKTDALLEVAAVCLGYNEQQQLVPVSTKHYHIEPFPGANLEQSALDFTGIDPFNPLRDAVTEKVALKGVFDEIRRHKNPLGCNRAVLVGHNASFDLGFIKTAVERTNIKRNPFHMFTCFDTATLAGVMLGQTVLAKACDVAGIDFDSSEAHSALYDAEKTAELFCYLINHYQTVAPGLAIADK